MNADRIQSAVKLIQNQTNYDAQTAEKKLKEWNYNTLHVIKEYLNPNFNKPKPKKEKSLNQRTMEHIRNFMDTANNQYIKRKSHNDYLKQKEEEHKQKVYKQFMDSKKAYPQCAFDPPKINTCKKDCPNPMCPGELSMDNKVYTKNNTKIDNICVNETEINVME
jgi:hypothetical protein